MRVTGTTHAGYLFTYFAPLGFVLTVTLGKEAWEDWKRYRRDRVRPPPHTPPQSLHLHLPG